MSAYNLEKRAPIQWGITHEPIAIEQYCKTVGVTVIPTGKYLKSNFNGRHFFPCTCTESDQNLYFL